MATICAFQSSLVALVAATEPVAPDATEALSHSKPVGRLVVPVTPVARLVNPDGIAVATTTPLPVLAFSEQPNNSSSSLVPATVNPVDEGLVVGAPLAVAPTTSIEHGPAIVACVISATVEPETQVTVNVLPSIPSAVRDRSC